MQRYEAPPPSYVNSTILPSHDRVGQGQKKRAALIRRGENRVGAAPVVGLVVVVAPAVVVFGRNDIVSWSM